MLLTPTYRPDDPGGAQLGVAASPHPPVVVLALLQEVLVPPEALLLIAHPARTAEPRGEWKSSKHGPLHLKQRFHRHSHPSQHFQGADAVHEGGLLGVRPAHEVPHVAGDGPRLSTEVGLVVDHHLDIHQEAYLKGNLSNSARYFTASVTYFRLAGVFHSGLPLW